LRDDAESQRGDRRVGVQFEIVEVRLSRSLRIAASFAQEAGVEQCPVELRIRSQSTGEPRLGLGIATQTVQRDSVVIRGFRAQPRALVGPDGLQLRRRFGGLVEAEERQCAVESCFLQFRLQRQCAVETDECLFRVPGQKKREASQILDFGFGRTGRLRAVELAQSRAVLAAQDVIDAAIAGSLRLREKRNREQERGQSQLQAAPRTCSSI